MKLKLYGSSKKKGKMAFSKYHKHSTELLSFQSYEGFDAEKIAKQNITMKM